MHGPQGLCELTVSGLDAIAGLGGRSVGRVVEDLHWQRFDASRGRVRKLAVTDTGHPGRDGTRALGELADQAARYHPSRHELTFNADLGAITDLIGHWRPALPGFPAATGSAAT